MPEPAASKSSEPGAAPKAAEQPKPAKKDGTRETIESIVVAFILAFLFRTFEAEAFVIPTGSMAPTLRGRHKEVHCEQCGWNFQIGASEEVDNVEGYYQPGLRINDAACPNCRHICNVRNAPVFKGDRILVNKFMYESGNPRRWDVVVFKYPEDPKTNYIKRLVGLPGDTLEIRQGDVYVHRDGTLEIQRKPDPDKQRELQMLVYDDRYPPRKLLEAGWPERWAGMTKNGAEGSVAGWSTDETGWKTDAAARTYTLDAAAAKEAPRWLRYRNIVPKPDDWNAVTENKPQGLRDHPPAELVTDFCGYNAYEAHFRDIEDGLYWVGDLTINFTAKVTEAPAGSTLAIELVEGNRRYRCRFQLESGLAEFFQLDDMNRGPDEEKSLGTATTAVKGTGAWNLAFANVDDRLCLWVNDALVEFDGKRGVDYEPYKARTLQHPWDEDVVPVGIAVQGASVQVSNLRLDRDVYYRGEFVRPQDYGVENPHLIYKEYQRDENSLRKLASQPEQWGDQYESGWIRNDANVPESAYVFELGPDEFFMMGDNSPRSKDSRLWPQRFRGPFTLHRHSVQRSSLVGKAFFIYWPHGVPFMNDGRGYPDDGNSMLNNRVTAKWFYHTTPVFDNNGNFIGTKIPEIPQAGSDEPKKDYYPAFRIPFYPNVERMERIR